MWGGCLKCVLRGSPISVGTMETPSMPGPAAAPASSATVGMKSQNALPGGENAETAVQDTKAAVQDAKTRDRLQRARSRGGRGPRHERWGTRTTRSR